MMTAITSLPQQKKRDLPAFASTSSDTLVTWSNPEEGAITTQVNPKVHIGIFRNAHINQYVFCGDNPVMFVDPWGLQSDEVYPLGPIIVKQVRGRFVEVGLVETQPRLRMPGDIEAEPDAGSKLTGRPSVGDRILDPNTWVDIGRSSIMVIEIDGKEYYILSNTSGRLFDIITHPSNQLFDGAWMCGLNFRSPAPPKGNVSSQNEEVGKPKLPWKPLPVETAPGKTAPSG